MPVTQRPLRARRNLIAFWPFRGRGHMPTGSSDDSASPSPEANPPSGAGRRQSWLAREGGRGGGWGHPVTWAAAGLVLLGGSGVAVLLHEPGGRARAQTAYCGLVTCAVLRSTAATSSVPAGAAHPTPAPSSPLASSRAPAPTATTIPSPAAAPSPGTGPAPAARSAPKPARTFGPARSHWRWPLRWPQSGWWGHGHGYPAAHSRGFSGWPGRGR
jgi:hypothetical protein